MKFSLNDSVLAISAVLGEVVHIEKQKMKCEIFQAVL